MRPAGAGRAACSVNALGYRACRAAPASTCWYARPSTGASGSGTRPDALVRPLQRLLGWRGEHREQPRGIRAVTARQAPADPRRCSWTSTWCRCRRTPPAWPIGRSTAPTCAPLSSIGHVHVGGIEVDDAPGRRLPEVDLVQHHALREQIGEGFAQSMRPSRASPASRTASTAGAGSRARCRRCTDRPAASSRRAASTMACVVAGAGKAQEIPGRVHEGVHGVGLARRPGSGRTGAVAARNAFVAFSGLPLPSGTRSSRQHHRQLVVRHRHVAADSAVDDRDRATPVALARNAPVAQPPVSLRLRPGPCASKRCAIASTAASKSRPSKRPELISSDRARRRHALPRSGGVRVPLRRAITGTDRQADIFVRTRSRAHRAPARPSRRLRRSPSARNCRPRPGMRAPVSGWIARTGPVGMPRFSMVASVRFRDTAAAGIRRGRPRSCRVALRRTQRQRMLRRHRAVGDAHERVGARREDRAARCVARQFVRGTRARRPRSADPVRLHRCARAPASPAASSSALEQFVGVARDAAGSTWGSRASRPARRCASRARRSPVRWRARSGRPGPS